MFMSTSGFLLYFPALISECSCGIKTDLSFIGFRSVPHETKPLYLRHIVFDFML